MPDEQQLARAPGRHGAMLAQPSPEICGGHVGARFVHVDLGHELDVVKRPFELVEELVDLRLAV